MYGQASIPELTAGFGPGEVNSRQLAAPRPSCIPMSRRAQDPSRFHRITKCGTCWMNGWTRSLTTPRFELTTRSNPHGFEPPTRAAPVVCATTRAGHRISCLWAYSLNHWLYDPPHDRHPRQLARMLSVLARLWNLVSFTTGTPNRTATPRVQHPHHPHLLAPQHLSQTTPLPGTSGPCMWGCPFL